jgi:ribosomal protein L24
MANGGNLMGIEPGDYVVVCGGLHISKSGWVIHVTRHYAKVALNSGFVVLVQKTNLCLIVDDEDKMVSKVEETVDPGSMMEPVGGVQPTAISDDESILA